MARKSRRTRRLRVVNPDCAGIDIGKDRHFVVHVNSDRVEAAYRRTELFGQRRVLMEEWSSFVRRFC